MGKQQYAVCSQIRQDKVAKMKQYTQLTHEQRYQIYALKKAGQKQTEIANLIGIHKSTISFELGRIKLLVSESPRILSVKAQLKGKGRPGRQSIHLGSG